MFIENQTFFQKMYQFRVEFYLELNVDELKDDIYMELSSNVKEPAHLPLLSILISMSATAP
jgi:hypothetical protein